MQLPSTVSPLPIMDVPRYKTLPEGPVCVLRNCQNLFVFPIVLVHLHLQCVSGRAPASRSSEDRANDDLAFAVECLKRTTAPRAVVQVRAEVLFEDRRVAECRGVCKVGIVDIDRAVKRGQRRCARYLK